MRFQLSGDDRAEIERYQLRWSCVHCAHRVPGDGRCSLEWPNDEQRGWPLDAQGEAATLPLCKEFELV